MLLTFILFFVSAAAISVNISSTALNGLVSVLILSSRLGTRSFWYSATWKCGMAVVFGDTPEQKDLGVGGVAHWF